MSTKTKLFSALALVIAVLLVAAMPASADEHDNDSTPGFTVNAGTGPRFDTDVPIAEGGTAADTNFPQVSDFGDVTLNGNPQLTSATIAPFTIIDDSGTGAGWNVTFTLPNFDGTTTAGLTPHVVATGASMNAPVLRAGNADSPLGGVYTKVGIDFTGAGQKIVIADPGNLATGGTDAVDHGNGYAPLGTDGTTHVAGMGTYLISPQILKLIVPNSTIADDYVTTANFTIATGP